MTGSTSETHASHHDSALPQAIRGSDEVHSSVVRPAWATVAAGAALGGGDLLAQRFVGYPWADLTNSPVLWAAAAFLIGWVVRSPTRSAAAGVVALVIAVLAYYLSAAAVLGDDVNNAFSGPAWFWYVGALGIGGVAGLAGAWCRSPVAWQVSCGAAVVPALLIAEASFHVKALLSAVALGWTLVTLGLLTWRHGAGGAARAVVAIVVLAAAARVVYSVVGLHGLSS